VDSSPELTNATNSGYWGIDENTPERFMKNARIAGVAERAAARVGDMREFAVR
jgi:hypothetical protein